MPKKPPEEPQRIRKFETGATRDTDKDKLDYEGFFSSVVLKAYAEYMHKHRMQTDGELRDSDNWQKGIPKSAYIKSLYRHFMDLWLEHRGYESREGTKEALYGIIFNSMGYLFETLKEEGYGKKGMKRERSLILAVLKRQHIKGKRRQGKAFESMISNAFKNIAFDKRNRFWFMRIWDFQTYVHINPMLHAPRQPADFLACSKGTLFFVECKSSQRNRFDVANFKPHQHEAMRQMAMIGGGYWLLILQRGETPEKQYVHALNYAGWIDLELEMKKKRMATAPWSLIKACASFTFQRESGGWNLKPLFR